MHSSATILQRDEAERLKSLLHYEILDTLPDPAFDEIARLAASISRAPYAYIGLVDWSRVWFKSRIGLSERQISRGGSPCQFVVADARALLIDDAVEDPRFPESGISLGPDLHCRSYAAAPLISPAGAVLGTLAIASPAPRAFDGTCLEDLQILARQVVTRLELYANGNERETMLRSRQRVEHALTVERNFVAAVLDTISALVLVLDTAGRIVRFNRASEAVSGYRSSELVGHAFSEELFPEDEREHALQIFEQARSGKLSERRELNWRSKTGRVRRIAWTATSLDGARNEVSFVIMTGVDITGQREAEDAVRTSEARYRHLVESSPGMVCTHDLAGVLLSINPHAAANLGYTAEELIGTPLDRYIDPAHADDFKAYLRAVQENLAAEGQSAEDDKDREQDRTQDFNRDLGAEQDRDRNAEREHRGLFYFKRRDGRRLIVAYRNKRLRLPGVAPFVLSHGIDITEQTEAEENLHALMRQHESILDSVGDGIWGMQSDGRLTFVNRSAARMFGYTVEELQGQNMHSLVHHSRTDGAPCPAEECRIFGSLKGETPVRVDDDVFWRKDGTSFPVEYVACPLLDLGRVEGIVVAFEDVTERRRLDRMKDEFISTVSHELRTPLTSLRAALGLVAGGALEKRPERIPQMLDIAINNCDRLARLVNDIVDFDRLGRGSLPLHRDDWNAVELLRRATDLERVTAARAGIIFRIDAQPVDVWVDGDRILQTLSNLIRNAIKFSDAGSEIRLGAWATTDREVTFEVQDQGHGIPPEMLDIIFDRFQQADASDSRSRGGTGLGLALCHSIIQQHGGRIWASSNPGHGSTFYFTVARYIPKVDSEPEKIGSENQ